MKHAWIALALLLVSIPARAGETAVAVTGRVTTPLQLTLADLKTLPRKTVNWSYTTRSHGDQKGAFTGALLWAVLDKAAVQNATPKDHLRHVIVVTGRDGYAVALAIAEVDPVYEGKSILLAYEKDGAPIEGGLKLVVPGDREGGRSVYDVVKIEVE